MILGLVAMILANTASVLGARAIVRRVGTNDGHVDAVLFVLIRIVLISGAVLLAGLTHGLRGPVLGVAGAVALVPLLLTEAKITFPRLPTRAPLSLAAIATGLIAVRLILQVWFFAPTTEDVLSYHLPKVAEWVRGGGFGRELGVDDHATFPAGFELVETWWVLFLHHDLLIEMAGIEFLILGAVAVYSVARSLGFSAKPAYWAGLCYAMTPGVMLQATSCLNDAPVAAVAVSAFALVAARVHWTFALMTAGLGGGIKATFFYAMPGICLLAFLVCRDSERRSSSPTGAFSLCAAGLLVGAYWYLRNLVLFGNPVYPIGEKALPIQAGPNLGSLGGNLLSLVNSRIYDRGPYGAYLDGIAGWGGVSFACGILGLILWMSEAAAVRRVAWSFLLSLATSLLMSRGDDFFMRFCLYFPAILCVAAVRLMELHPRVLPCLAAGLGFQFVGTFLPYDVPLPTFRTLASQGWQERSAAALFGFSVHDPVVAYFATNRGPVYCLYGPDFSRRVVYLRRRTTDALVNDMKQGGARALYISALGTADRNIIEDCLKAGTLSQVSENVYTLQDSP